MTTTKYNNKLETFEENLEEIFLERTSYLISTDDLIEQILSKEILENSVNSNQSFSDKSYDRYYDIIFKDYINTDTPIKISSDFKNI